MSSDSIPFAIKQASRSFNKNRADYYVYMASILKSSGGGIKILQLFENDIVRFEGKPRGKLCLYWYEQYSANGGNLADAFQGTLPDDEVAILRVAQNAGGDALIFALDDLARMAKLSDQVKQESLSTIVSGLFGIAIAFLMLTIFPIFSVREIANAYEFLPLDAWGQNGQRFYSYAKWMEGNLFAITVIIGILIVALNWTFSNYTGKFREWLDENISLYRVSRDLKGALFLATMSTLTKKRGGVMFTLKQSLETFSNSARTPWLRWRIDQIIDGADSTGSIGVQAFDTGMISREMFYFLEDMQKAKGFSEGFEETGAYVEGHLMKSTIKKMMFYRWSMLVMSLVVALVIFGWQFQVIYEMRGAMSSFLATG